MWVAGGGEKVTLRIAAEYADYTNFGPALAEFVAKSAILQEHCKDVGRDFGSIVRSANFNVVIGETERTSRTGWRGSRTLTARPGPPRRGSRAGAELPQPVRRSARPSRSSRRCRASRTPG